MFLAVVVLMNEMESWKCVGLQIVYAYEEWIYSGNRTAASDLW